MSLHNRRFIFFTVVGVCAVAMAAARSGFAMPSGGSETPTLSSRELEEIPLRQIYNGIRVLREGVRHMLLGGQIPPAPVVSEG